MRVYREKVYLEACCTEKDNDWFNELFVEFLGKYVADAFFFFECTSTKAGADINENKQ
jgi:hypothetical protein